MKNKVERGDIYWYNFGQNEGSVQNGIRPALVIQATNFNANSPTTIIAAITTAQKGMYLPSHIFLGERYGLDRPSTVMLEQIRTVNQNELGPYIGTVEDHTTLNAVSKALKRSGLVAASPAPAAEKAKKRFIGVYIVAAMVLVSCVFAVLVMKGII